MAKRTEMGFIDKGALLLLIPITLLLGLPFFPIIFIAVIGTILLRG